MALLEDPKGNPFADLTRKDIDEQGMLKTESGELALVVGSAVKAEQFMTNKQWSLLWRDADLLYQSPRPMSVYENTYVLEPNVQRFTVAKVANAIVPQLYKGLFYDDPPMLLRPRPGTSQDVVDAKTSIFSYFLDACNFKRDTKWGLEQMALLGTGIWKWGVDYVKVQKKTRKASVTNINGEQVVVAEEPQIEVTEELVCQPFFEWRPLSRVLIDDHTEVGDIREAAFAIDVRYMDWYQLNMLKEAHKDEEGWDFPEDLQSLWFPPVETMPARLMTESQTLVTGAVHHSEEKNIDSSTDPLLKKMEVLEYWSKDKKILVLDRKQVLYSGANPFNKIPFLSCNWWNRPMAFYGMGLGLVVGQNQRVDQGTINAILKILSFGVNPIYLRSRDSNSPTQMIRTGIGKILTVDGEAAKAYSLLETPRVPPDVWSALAENERNTESTSGADAMLVQGSSAGPRSSMGRTAGGAAQLGAASATRLDGPLDNFIDQVFKPFLYILDDLIFTYVSDRQIMDILGDELGQAFTVDMNEYHAAKIEYEVLAGASLSAKRQMAQSLTLITQIFENPQIQQNLAEINEEYIDFKPILNMWMEASEWKNKQDIIKPLTPAMKQKIAAQQQAAQQNNKKADTMEINDQKFQQKQQLEDQANDNRIKREIVREAFRNSAMASATTGEPSDRGLGGGEPQVI